MVWRRLRIAADTSLAALHFIFQIVQGWGDDHLHQFHIYGKDYGISYEGGIGFVDNPFRVVIDDFAFDAGDRFTYEYNFWHCCKVSDEAAFCLIQRPYISKTLLTRRISPRGSP
ncbi:plasmid pRiA4b ORF-3 family protein [Escherichia coli]|uniref:plasmid pRiA4b ORF-3 family protein n=1 Tax=Escherichia coli TaxID=562 RepID=UPI003F7410E8